MADVDRMVLHLNRAVYLDRTMLVERVVEADLVWRARQEMEYLEWVVEAAMERNAVVARRLLNCLDRQM